MSHERVGRPVRRLAFRYIYRTVIGCWVLVELPYALRQQAAVV
jgi:hypothetical protein